MRGMMVTSHSTVQRLYLAKHLQTSKFSIDKLSQAFCRGKDRTAMEAKERMAEARGERAFSEETESYGNMTNLKTDVNAYDIRSFLGTMARRTRCERTETGGVLRMPGMAPAEVSELRPNCVKDGIS